MDRASDSGSEGWGFESLPVYQKTRYPFGYLVFCISGRRDSNPFRCNSPVDCCPMRAEPHRLLNFLWHQPKKMQIESRLRFPAETSPDEAGLFLADRGTRCALAVSATGSARARGPSGVPKEEISERISPLLAFRAGGTRIIKCGVDERRRRRLDGAEPLSAPTGSRCKRVPFFSAEN